MKPTSLTTLAALILIGVGGFMAGRISSSPNAAANKEDSATTQSSRGMSPSAIDRSNNASGKSRHSEHETRVSAMNSTERLGRLTSILRTENPLERNRALLAFIDQLSPNQFEEVVANFRSMGITQSRMGEYAMLLSGWAAVDPMGALAYAKANTRSEFAANTILTTWAANDPEGAIRWAEANHTGDGANPYLAGIIRSLSATDPARATQLLTGMPKSIERGEALDAMLPQLLTKGVDATREWIGKITDDSLRSGAMMRVADTFAAKDPAGTAAWLLANPSEATRRSLDNVYGAWAQQDQQAAVNSFTAMPSGEDRSNALRGIITSIATQDPNTAVTMMNKYPNDVTDHVVQSFVWHSMGSDPTVAVNQIARITDETERNRTYSRVLSNWRDQDPTAANAWIQNNPLPPAVQARLNRQ